MLTLIFLLLCTSKVARGSLKTYCLKSNNECDDTWRPKDLDNIDAALVGYDLPSGNFVVYYLHKLLHYLFTIFISTVYLQFYFSGNPFSSDFIEDPGLRKQIFNATIPSEEEKDENKGYVLYL